MAAMRPNKRLQVGSNGWIIEERSNALQLAETEAEEFTFAARNEIEWLNEHMAEIFTKNQVNVAEIFKTPGKLRGKTPRTARKLNQSEVRAPLSDVFSATPQGAPSPFRQTHYERSPPKFRVAEDAPTEPQEEPTQSQRTPSQPTPSQRPSSSGTINNSIQHKTFINALDSGYYGSQLEEATQPNSQPTEPAPFASTPPRPFTPRDDIIENQEETAENAEFAENEGRQSEEPVAPVEENTVTNTEGEERRIIEDSFQSAQEDSPIAATTEMELETEVQQIEEDKEAEDDDQVMGGVEYPNLESPIQDQSPVHQSPEARFHQKSPSESPAKSESPLKEASTEPQSSPMPQDEDEQMDDAPDAQSGSEGSSPIRPIFRKSSLNFASLPARDLSKKSLGHRTSRTSHLDQTRTSHYGRPTGGKSLGNVKEDLANKDEDEMDTDEMYGQNARDDTEAETLMARIHNKTSTQRLQDQISMLGQSQPATRPASKSLVGGIIASRQSTQAVQPPTPQNGREESSPQQKDQSFATPGAFPEDEDSWIGPHTAALNEKTIFSPRPTINKTHTTDVMENIHNMETVGGSAFVIPKRGYEGRQTSPVRETNTPALTKSISTSFIPSPKRAVELQSPNKLTSVSNPNLPITTVNEDSTTPPKSPPRTLRGSPLKVAKDKFSSILKSGKTLFASSAAASAEAKIETLSSSSIRVHQNSAPSFEDVLQSETNDVEVSYPKMDMHFNDHAPNRAQSPVKPTARRTRASTEKEEKRKEEAAREAKEAQRMNDQLEKARMKVKEDARVYHQEQERAATLQREVTARKEQEKLAKSSQVDVPKASRISPRKTKAQLEAEAMAAAAVSSVKTTSTKDVEMTDASSSMPPPSIPRPKSQIGRPQAKRPLKPVKDTAPKAKAPATVIRVDTGSSRGQQYHPSNTTLAATLEQSLQSNQPGHLRNKASNSSLQSKSSTNSFKAQANKALEAAARKKEADELAAQQRRDAKLEMERQRAATKEEQRRQNELTIKREREQKEISLSEANKKAIERAKQKRAPPPAIRPQHNIDQWQDKTLPPVPPQRNDLGGQSKATRINTAKAPPKRPLQENNEEAARPTMQRNGPSNQGESRPKRQRTNEYLDEEDELTESHPKMTAPPIRQSSIRPKEMPTKSLFASGYAHAPPPANLQRSTIVSQHQNKIGNPMDMTQVSKGAIPFATSSNGQSYKTPARIASHASAKAARSAAKSSPRYENGENIVLPEIPSDSEDDEDEDEEKSKKEFQGLGWTDSPEIRKQLALQESIDPSKIFGRPQALNMEEVFDKSKDRFHKFRARTSSANWSGSDRLTEEEVRKDLEGRDRVRRQGGWSYDPSF